MPDPHLASTQEISESPQFAAVVTGSSRGLGWEIAAEMASWGTVTVYGLDLSLDAPDGVRALECDVTDSAAVRAAAAAITASGARVRYVVSNAGRYPNRPLAQWTLDDFTDLWRLNVGGAFNVFQTFLPHLAEDWSRIIAVTSNAARLSVPGFAPYASTKAGLEAFVRCLAAEVGATGVTVNAIAPGLTRTANALSSDVAPFFDAVRDGQLIPRSLEAVDVLHAIRYLCDCASSMVTGQTLVVDGGVALP